MKRINGDQFFSAQFFVGLPFGSLFVCLAQRRTVFKLSYQRVQRGIRDKCASYFCSSIEKRTNGTLV